ncbi:MAG: nucleoside-triphosphatase [Candidatus Bipolaricaulis anaerobius]|nr:nucleoside-triphosphatase [Candidatus Bipolaricaulis anaerobius]
MSGDLLGAALAARTRARAMVLTGGIGVGKTRAVLTLAGDLRRQHLRVGGVASPRVLVGRETVGYLVRDLTTGEEHPLCSRPAPGLPFRRFTFSPEGLAFANAALVRATREAEVIVVDEVGPLELSGGGFTPGLRAALGSPAFLILTARPALVDEVRAWAGLAGVPTIELRPPDDTSSVARGPRSTIPRP